MSAEKKLPKFLHKLEKEFIENEFVVKHEEFIVDGEKGIKIKYFHVDKKGKKKIRGILYAYRSH